MLILSQNGGLKTDFAVICRAVVKASVSGQPPVQPGVVDAKMKTVFAFAAEAVGGGSAGDTPCPLNSAFGEQDNGGGNDAGHARNTLYFGPRVLSCISVFDRKKHCFCLYV